MYKTFKRIFLAFICTVMCFSVASFSDTGREAFDGMLLTAQAAEKSTHLKKTEISVMPGQKYTQKLINSKGKTISATKVKWKSSSKKIATVSKKGVVTGKKKGTTKITATYKGKKYTFTVKVKNPSFRYTGVKMAVKDSFTQYLKDASGNKIKTSSVKWSSSKPSVASVSSKGKIKAKKAGTAKISATYKGKKYSFTVKVSKKLTPSISLNKNSIAVYETKSEKLTTTKTPVYAKVKWTSDNPSVASVSSNGTVKGKKSGTAKVTASITYKKKTYKSTCYVVVEKRSATLAKPLKEKQFAVSSSSVAFQSFYDFCGGDIACAKISNGFQRFTYSYAAYEKLLEYVEMLDSSPNINLKLDDSYYFSYTNKFFSYAFTYTGTADIKPDNEMTFGDNNKKYAVEIWGSNASSNAIYINWSDGMEYTDMGYRIGGTKVPVIPAGISAVAGVTRYDDTFRTTDNRFTVNVGKASVIRNSVRKTVNADCYVDSTKKLQTVTIDFNTGNKIKLHIPFDSIKTGDIFYLDDLSENSKKTYSKDKQLSDSNFRLLFGSDSWFIPAFRGSDIDGLTLRIMYCDARRIVFYLYLDNNNFDGGSEVEIFCAANLKKAKEDEQERIKEAERKKREEEAKKKAEEEKKKKEEANKNNSSNSSNNSFNSSSTGNNRCGFCGGSGSRDCLTCNGRGYVTHYVSTPNYSGHYGGSSTVTKRCPSVMCNGGSVRCSYCGGDGRR